MPRINYNDLWFDSQLEVDYYKYLLEQQENGVVLDFVYHPSQIPNLIYKRSYTPDFIVLYKDRVEVVETKGFNQFSFRIDDQIHNAMKAMHVWLLRDYVNENMPRFSKVKFDAGSYNVIYKKVKYLKAHGWVDYEWKNPNTLSNQRKVKITELEQVLKEQSKKLKDYGRFVEYVLKIQDGGKLTKQQREWYMNFVKEFRKQWK